MAKSVDVIVLGGGVKGCAVAKKTAKLGYSVALVEPRQFLGYELTATGHGWTKNSFGETNLLVGALRKQLLSQMLEYGVMTLLNTHCGGILTERDRSAGVLLADSYGLQMLRGKLVLDTEGFLFAKPTEQMTEATVHYVFRVQEAKPAFEKVLYLPSEYDCFGEVSLHEEIPDGHILVEFAFQKSLSYLDRVFPQRLLPEAQRRAADIFSYLKKEVPSFSGSIFGDDFRNEVWLSDLPFLEQFDVPNGYECCSEILPEPITDIGLENMTDRLEQWTAELCENLSTAEPCPDGIICKEQKINLSDCTVSDFQEDAYLQRIELPHGISLPGVSAKVFVAGGGTAGKQVLKALTEYRIPTVAVDQSFMLGGTNLIGGVLGYWHGYQGGVNAEIDAKANEIAKKIREDCSGKHIGIHTLLQNQELQEKSAAYFCQSVICGIEKQGKKLTRAICCGRGGLFSVEADIMIDATGDGVLSVLAGAEYSYGDSRDGSAQTYSAWGVSAWKKESFLDARYLGDYDVVDMDSYRDYLRCIYLAQLQNSDEGSTPFLTVRESRRIRGDYTLTMADIWEEKIFPDTLSVTDTPFDTHGHGSNIFCNMKLCNAIAAPLRARVPYRCYLVKDTENLMITAKAFSATRDASSVCRMNADLRNSGYAVGLCAAWAIRHQTDLRSVDISAIQEKLYAKKCLPEWTTMPRPRMTKEELLQNLSVLAEDDLREAFRQTDSVWVSALAQCRPTDAIGSMRQKNLSLWHGDGSVATEILAFCKEKLALGADILGKEHSEEYSLLCQSLTALYVSNCLSAEELASLVSLAQSGGCISYAKNGRYNAKIYGFDRVDGWRIPLENVLYILCEMVEHQPDKKLIVPMEKLLSDENLHGFLTINGTAENVPTCHGIAPIFGSFLEVRLTAAASRCGSKAALFHLTEFLREDRSLLRKFARRELEAISGTSFGWNCSEWQKWIAAQNEILPAAYCGKPIME